ncbi:MAG: hypothetical protein U1E32_11265 [Rhodoglobus sp.]|nr:hypothetical protein [Rhodoglobus sp.]
MSDRTRYVERAGPAGFMLLLAYIGAAIYFISHSDGSFWGVILGLLQAIVWPVYVVYHVLGVLGA